MIWTSAAVFLLLVALLTTAYLYLDNLEKSVANGTCVCAHHEDIRSMKQYLALIAVLTFVFGVFKFYGYSVKWSTGKWATLVSVVAGITLLVLHVRFVYMAYRFITFLRSSNCLCATSGIGDEALGIYAFFLAFAILYESFLPFFMKSIRTTKNYTGSNAFVSVKRAKSLFKK